MHLLICSENLQYRDIPIPLADISPVFHYIYCIYHQKNLPDVEYNTFITWTHFFSLNTTKYIFFFISPLCVWKNGGEISWQLLYLCKQCQLTIIIHVFEDFDHSIWFQKWILILWNIMSKFDWRILV